MQSVSAFMERNYKHFNARETLDAAKAWKELLADGGQMFLTMGGAMSTAELGISLAEMIRQDKVHAISCTAANLEEDVFNLFSNKEYKFVRDYRSLTAQDEHDLRESGYNRVTDTCIPETCMRHVADLLAELWTAAAKKGEARFPYEYMFEVLDRKELAQHYQIDPADSWLLAAKKKKIAVYTPGWEDSTMACMFTARIIQGEVSTHSVVRHGTEQLQHLGDWYLERVKQGTKVGFFQIGGGISGDFAICTVPMLIQDLEMDVPYWSYFAQIGDSVTSYGSYSGAVPNEKITWGKLAVDTPKFMINSDASIVAPLIFEYVLGR